ncbi:molybdopterin-dependent oxidoreductase [Bradyrhizobium sp. CNPSo 4026]|nr:molybdopterin-dependent oxidoreductase [Bradyrhizobium cenepequi]
MRTTCSEPTKYLWTVELAAQKVRAKAIAFASHKLEVGEQDLELECGAVYVKGVRGMNVSLSEISRTLAGNVGMSLPGGMEPDLAATAYFNSTALTFAYGANACEVEIDLRPVMCELSATSWFTTAAS